MIVRPVIASIGSRPIISALSSRSSGRNYGVHAVRLVCLSNVPDDLNIQFWRCREGVFSVPAKVPPLCLDKGMSKKKSISRIFPKKVKKISFSVKACVVAKKVPPIYMDKGVPKLKLFPGTLWNVHRILTKSQENVQILYRIYEALERIFAVLLMS